VQTEALARRFDTLRPKLEALSQLASRQGVEQIKSIGDTVPVLFDHRVYKSYPAALIEQRNFARMTKWIQRLTTCDLSATDCSDLDSVDSWLDRLGDHGLSVGHTTGTSGKLSFLPRSDEDWPAYTASINEMQRGMFGFDPRTTDLPYFSPTYRRAHYYVGARLNRRIAESQVRTERFHAHPHEIPVDLIAMAARLQSADASGQLGKLKVEAKLLEQREALIERSRNRESELEAWLRKLSDEYRGVRVFIQGTGADLVRAMLRGRELGIDIAVAPDSIFMTGGGMKGYKDAPVSWEDELTDYFGVEQIFSTYGMTECLAAAGACQHGFYHVPPYLLPIVLDDDFLPLPRVGAQTGRYAFFDFLAETEWGGYITEDAVTIHWSDACACGRQGPRIDRDIKRVSELAGRDDDKISCAGIAEAYDSFMDFVSTI
jgi:hypothetical protein